MTFGVLSPCWLWLSKCSPGFLPKLIPQHLARFAEPLRGSVRAAVLTFGVLPPGWGWLSRCSSRGVLQRISQHTARFAGAYWRCHAVAGNAPTGLRLAFEVQLQSGAATDPPAYCEICRCVLALPCGRRECSHRAGAGFRGAAPEWCCNGSPGILRDLPVRIGAAMRSPGMLPPGWLWLLKCSSRVVLERC